MSYRDAKSFLESKTVVHELINELGGRIAVCPEWNGRVMTSTWDGLDGDSAGLIRVREIERGPLRDACLAIGGEDQFGLSPTYGSFGVRVFPEDDFPEGLYGYREGPFEVDSIPTDPILRMRRSIQFVNRQRHQFELNILRSVRLLSLQDIQHSWGGPLYDVLDQNDVSYVGFETSNTVINLGLPLHPKTGLFSIQTRSMFNASSHVVVFVPFRVLTTQETNVPELELEFYYGKAAPHGVFRRDARNILLRADGKRRCAVSVPKKQVCPYLGAVDYHNGTLLLVRFSVAELPENHDYLSDFPSRTTVRDGVLLPGGVLQVYNGDTEEMATGREEELPCFTADTFSPAVGLSHSEAMIHRQSILHISADKRTLAYLIHRLFGVKYDQVYDAMLR